MKKTYITPKAMTFAINTEHHLCVGSTIGINRDSTVDQNSILGKRRGGFEEEPEADGELSISW